MAAGAAVGGMALLGKGLKDSVNAAADFQQTLNVLKATSGATGTEMDAISKKAIALGADIHLPATSAKDAAQAMLELARGGFTAKQAMAAAHGTLLLSAAAQIDNATAGRMVVQALNAFKLPAKDAKTVVDDFAGAANASTASMTDVADAMQQSAVGFKTLNIPIGDATTAIAKMSNAGINGGVAGSSLNVALVKLAAPTAKAAALMHELGINAFDSKGQFIGMTAFTQQFSTVMEGLTQHQRLQAEATIFGTRGMKAAGIVFGDGAKALDDLRDKVTRTGQAQDLANAQTQGFRGAMAGFQSTLETLEIQIGLKLLPVLTRFLNWMTKELPVATAFVTKIIAEMTAAYEKHRVQIEHVFDIISSVISAFVAFTREHWDTISSIISFAVNNIIDRIRAIYDVIDGVVKLIQDVIHGRWSNIWGDAKQIVSGVVAYINAVMLGIPGKILGVLGDVKDAAASVGTAIVSGIMNGMGGLLSALINAVQSAVSSALDTVTGGLLGDGTGNNTTGRSHGHYKGGVTVGKGATGGIVTRATLALIGEAGPEAVVPLNRTAGSSALGGGGGGGGGVTVIVNGWVGNDQDIAERVRNELIRMGRRTTGGVLGGF